MKIIIILIAIALFVCVYRKTSKKTTEGFNPLKKFYNNKHKMIRRKLQPKIKLLQGYWKNFSENLHNFI